jgi:hypothetical protein
MTDLQWWTGKLPISMDTANVVASRIATLEATLSKNTTVLSSMTYADKALWIVFKTTMVSQYSVNKCAQIYSQTRMAWQTCCAYDSVGATSFSFCAASTLLSIPIPSRAPARGIDFGYDPAIVAALPTSVRQAENTQGKNSANSLGNRIQHQLLINTIPVYSVNLFSGAPAGRCTSSQLQYACFSMCCDSVYARVRLPTACCVLKP